MILLKKHTETLYVWRNIQLNRSRLLIFVTLVMLGFLLFIMDVVPYASVGLILIPIAYGLGIYTYRKHLIWGSGSEGEKIVINELKKLDDTYCLISGVVIPPNRGDVDHIVLGRNGIFVVETKNYSGEVSCNGDVWGRRKIGRRGKPYPLEIGNPSNQVKRNAKVLKDFILRHQREIFKKTPHIWVEGILVFTNPAVVLKIKNPTVSIVSPNKLVEFIKNNTEGTGLSEREVKNLGNVIMKHAEYL